MHRFCRRRNDLHVVSFISMFSNEVNHFEAVMLIMWLRLCKEFLSTNMVNAFHIIGNGAV